MEHSNSMTSQGPYEPWCYYQCCLCL